MRSLLRLAGLLVVLVGGLIPTAVAAAQGAGGGGAQNAVVRADVITEAQPLGWRVVAVAIVATLVAQAMPAPWLAGRLGLLEAVGVADGTAARPAAVGELPTVREARR